MRRRAAGTVVFLLLGQLLFLFLTSEETPQPYYYNTVYDVLPSGILTSGSTSSSSSRVLLSSSPSTSEEKEEFLVDRSNVLTTTTTARLELVLCTHLSVDKLDRLSIQQEAWKGPMSVAVYITSDEDESKYQHFRSTYHQVNDTMSFSTYREHNQSLIHLYPHNILRNLAIQHASSDYILSLDVDFLPSQNAYTELISKLRKDYLFRESLERQKTLYILPVFALSFGIHVPSSASSLTRDELVIMYNNQTAKQWHYAPGHARILYDAWIANNRSSGNHTLMNDFSYLVEPNPEFEPYFLCHLPPEGKFPKYWEDFRGFGFDKSSLIQELALNRYEFRVLWDYFVVHLHHDRNNNDNKVDRNSMANRNGNIWWKEFTPYLLDKYHPKGIDQRFLYPRFVDYYRISRQQKRKKQAIETI